MSTYNTLVLSGNGTNAPCTLGALQLLYEQKILCAQSLSSYYGTSSGSIIGTLLALGFEPLDILTYVCVNRCYSKVSGINLANITGGGLLNFDTIESELTDIIISKVGYVPTLEDVKTLFDKTLVVVTYNLTTGLKEYVSAETYPQLPVTKAIRMSCTFPFVFNPYWYNNCYYIDGGIVDNFPMYAAQLKPGNRCLGLYNNNPVKPYSPETTNYLELFLRLITVFIASAAENTPILGDNRLLQLSYEPSFFNFTSSTVELSKMFESGYKTCATKLGL